SARSVSRSVPRTSCTSRTATAPPHPPRTRPSSGPGTSTRSAPTRPGRWAPATDVRDAPRGPRGGPTLAPRSCLRAQVGGPAALGYLADLQGTQLPEDRAVLGVEPVDELPEGDQAYVLPHRHPPQSLLRRVHVDAAVP